jgi:catechol 2,3-dioxygenase
MAAAEAAGRIPADSGLGTVWLDVARLDRLVAWYERYLGFRIHRREGRTVYPGAGRQDILVLSERPEGRRYGGTTGLYHFAVVLPDRARWRGRSGACRRWPGRTIRPTT